ncbi:MAG: FGGY-family carbohydrate kinase [Eubacterium coprostanoligenes]|uniref:xylulokinase n=1 Tax=Eubacterium coprostanoligenes TaxID=290054 RepID=UPI0023F3D0FF|nr:FGGY-family carbohydrate kinase [Eubacterium coprostanoligenes]MDD7358452.1 FGGY-family carbohydrate kinase [Eubacterium coprostanoligenes]
MDYRLDGTESLGIEFGSTRIKAVLIDKDFNPIASGSYTWENKFENGIWTYAMDEVWQGLQTAYKNLNVDCENKFGAKITKLASLGFSAMMHGYLPLDKDGNQLCEFRTWRNTITGESAKALTELFGFNIPQRWSVAHLYQAILNGEKHTKDIDFLTTLAGYVHYKLSGQKVVGVGEASGMFPIDSTVNDYNSEMAEKFNALPKVKKLGIDIVQILPKVLVAGENAGFLTEEGARLIDPSGNLEHGVPMAPPEGDAGTGMTATNSIAVKTGNVSAGTSIFSMVVLENQLSKVYEEIDMVTTPVGKPVAMVHCNNCCTDLDYWVNVFGQFASAIGAQMSKPELYDALYESALYGEPNAGGLVNINYFSGEPVSHTDDGRPLFVRTQNANFNLANFMRSQIYSTIATLKIGMEILEKENVTIDCLMGHGGLFKTPLVGQKLMAGAMNCPVAVMKTAGEGGAWGMAVLAKYVVDGDEPLDEYLNNKVFANSECKTVAPDENDVNGFNEYMKLYKSALKAEVAAYENI